MPSETPLSRLAFGPSNGKELAAPRYTARSQLACRPSRAERRLRPGDEQGGYDGGYGMGGYQSGMGLDPAEAGMRSLKRRLRILEIL